MHISDEYKWYRINSHVSDMSDMIYQVADQNMSSWIYIFTVAKI